MKKLVIKDLAVVELSIDEAATIHGGLDNKPAPQKPQGSELLDLLDNPIGLPVPGTWLGASDLIRS